MTDLGPGMAELLHVVRSTEVEFAAVEIPIADIIEGAPRMEVGPVWTSADGSKVHGISRVSPGRFWFAQPCHETTHILSGRMTITLADGTSIPLQAGDVVHLQPGARWDLTVIESIEDSWTVSSAAGRVSN